MDVEHAREDTVKRQRRDSWLKNRDEAADSVAGPPRVDAPPQLHIITDLPLVTGCGCENRSSVYSSVQSGDAISSPDSLFDEISDHSHTISKEIAEGGAENTGSDSAGHHGSLATSDSPILLARRKAPPIPGFFFDPTVELPSSLAEDILRQCMESYFKDDDVNQVMLFERAQSNVDTVLPASGFVDHASDAVQSEYTSHTLPSFLQSLLQELDVLFKPLLPQAVHKMLFPPPSMSSQARQAIINMYRPGEGISPHVDLLGRFGDGIIGVSLGSGCVMSFCKVTRSHDNLSDGSLIPEVTSDQRWELYLPQKSVLVLSGDSRYGWTHGIDGRKFDYVEEDSEDTASVANPPNAQWLPRSVRLSITFRWLLPGADIVGGLGS